MPETPGRDWRKIADVAQQEMLRRARELIDSANLIRAEMGLEDFYQVRRLHQRVPRKPVTGDQRRAAMRQELERESREGGVH